MPRSRRATRKNKSPPSGLTPIFRFRSIGVNPVISSVWVDFFFDKTIGLSAGSFVLINPFGSPPRALRVAAAFLRAGNRLDDKRISGRDLAAFDDFGVDPHLGVVKAAF